LNLQAEGKGEKRRSLKGFASYAKFEKKKGKKGGGADFFLIRVTDRRVKGGKKGKQSELVRIESWGGKRKV